MKSRSSSVTTMGLGILLVLAAPVAAQSNGNDTVQVGQVNINRTSQCGDTNTNRTDQEGRVNINQTSQRACVQIGHGARRPPPGHDRRSTGRPAHAAAGRW